jgi:hypothetical protein
MDSFADRAWSFDSGLHVLLTSFPTLSPRDVSRYPLLQPDAAATRLR